MQTRKHKCGSLTPNLKEGGKVIVKCKSKCNSEEKQERVFLVRVQYVNQKEKNESK